MSGVPSTWHDLESARRLWRDAPQDDEQLQTLLDVAQQQVEAFAPQLPAVGIPTNYRLAQLTQARNLWNVAQVSASGGEVGVDGFALRPVPLDWAVRAIIRPKRAIPAIG